MRLEKPTNKAGCADQRFGPTNRDDLRSLDITPFFASAATEPASCAVAGLGSHGCRGRFGPGVALVLETSSPAGDGFG